MRKVSDCVSLEPEQFAALREVSIRTGRSKASLYREGIAWVLDKYKIRGEPVSILVPEERDHGCELAPSNERASGEG